MVDKCAVCGTSDSKTLALCCHPQCPARSFHDKAVAKPYRCGVCGTSDPDAYMRCDHPGCPDGRDQARNGTPTYPPAPVSLETRKSGRVVLLVILFAIISLIYACTARFIGS